METDVGLEHNCNIKSWPMALEGLDIDRNHGWYWLMILILAIWEETIVTPQVVTNNVTSLEVLQALLWENVTILRLVNRVNILNWLKESRCIQNSGWFFSVSENLTIRNMRSLPDSSDLYIYYESSWGQRWTDSNFTDVADVLCKHRPNWCHTLGFMLFSLNIMCVCCK